MYLPCLQYNILSPASQILDEEINYNGFSPKNADKKKTESKKTAKKESTKRTTAKKTTKK